MLTIDVKASVGGIGKKLGKLSKDSGLGTYAANTMQKMMRPFIPERDSILINSYNIKPWHVTYDAPYAAPMYYGVVKGTNVKYHKSTARPKWDTHVDKADYTRQLEGYVKKMM